MKTLKMTGLDNYISPMTKGIALKRDDVIRVDDKVADHMLIGEEVVRSLVTSHFTVVDDSTRALHDFTTGDDEKVQVSDSPQEIIADDTEPASQTGLVNAAKPAKPHTQRATRTPK